MSSAALEPQAAPEASFRFNELSAKELSELSARELWSLNAAELAAIQAHFRGLRREPTRAEIETIAQTWSEHCKHKTFTGPIRYTARSAEARARRPC